MPDDMPDKKKIAANCWNHGNQVAMRQDWEYAVKMYLEAVKNVPDNLTYRQTLRGAERKMYKENKSGARMSSIRSVPIRGRVKKARTKEDWDEMDQAAEEGLVLNPWDAQFNADAGEACKERGYFEVAVFCYQRAVEADPENVELNRQLALLYEDRGNYSDSIKCWERIHKVEPLNSEARQKITQLQADEMIDRGKYEEAGSAQDVRNAYDMDRKTRRQAEAVPDAPGMDEEADLQRATRKNPEDSGTFLKLGEFYRDAKRYEDALETFKQALQVSGGDPNIREQVEDIELELMKQNLTLARSQASQDEKKQKLAAQMAIELLKRETEVLHKRVERYPNDVKLRYELAQRLMRQKKFQEAIPLLQRAVTDQRLQVPVLIDLGKCFVHVRNNKLAQRQFEKAAELIDSSNQPEQYAEVHYMLGRLSEEAGQSQEAEKYYNEVLSADYSYKDALQRLEKLQGGGEPAADSV